MPDLTHGKESSIDGTPISRRSFLVGRAAMVVAAAALPAATYVASTKRDSKEWRGLPTP